MGYGVTGYADLKPGSIRAVAAQIDLPTNHMPAVRYGPGGR